MSSYLNSSLGNQIQNSKFLCVSTENFKAVCEVKCESPADSTGDYRDFIRYNICRKAGRFIDGIQRNGTTGKGLSYAMIKAIRISRITGCKEKCGLMGFFSSEEFFQETQSIAISHSLINTYNQQPYLRQGSKSENKTVQNLDIIVSEGSDQWF